MCAAWQGHEKIVKLLLAAKADITIKDIWGGTAKSMAKKNEFKNIVAMIEAQEKQICSML